MQAIITKYLPATNFKPSRIKASCERGSLILSTGSLEPRTSDERSDLGNLHRAACDALCAQFDAKDSKRNGVTVRQWSKPKASGQIPTGEYVFCFIQDRVLGRRGGAS